ncbi:hypothetical protein MTE2_4195 [Klebsiella pneumoniae VA360]|uniref:Uncharacterized protein n=1 Tax=Klebsiella pneumoniae 30684/NJST258_2 TaxID=1420013 RepID=W8UNI4_KLEPN|nr:hypothetical protein KPNJ2_03835 [Klebsiella pneumoniae 30684/NJST258_2]EMI37606.1 hypothetical protein MTE2_4195 [Klebsiella pneumoniae VA360]VXZ87073.1 Uncharacterised protein [Klebsiella pneumoniae]
MRGKAATERIPGSIVNYVTGVSEGSQRNRSLNAED